MDAREQRGLELAATKQILRQGKVWMVPSQASTPNPAQQRRAENNHESLNKGDQAFHIRSPTTARSATRVRKMYSRYTWILPVCKRRIRVASVMTTFVIGL